MPQLAPVSGSAHVARALGAGPRSARRKHQFIHRRQPLALLDPIELCVDSLQNLGFA
jgi:hypothetical protein